MREDSLILIAEDSPTQAEKLRFLLEENQFHVIVARNGKEALHLLNTEKPILIITDIVMPEMDGYELCETVKSDPQTKDIPVLLLTSLSDPEDVIKGLLCGADNFVTKPYHEKVLLSQVEYILMNQAIRETHQTDIGIEIYFSGKRHKITSNRLQIIDLLLSTYENAVQKKQEVERALNELTITQEELKVLNERLEERVLERTERIDQLNRLLMTIRDINQLIIETHDRNKLLREACRIFIDGQLFSNVWIVLFDQNRNVSSSFSEGYSDNFIQFQDKVKNGEMPRCIQDALSRDKLVILKSAKDYCDDCPLYSELENSQVFIIALRAGEKVFGVLCAAALINNPTEEIISLFEEVSGDIAFALKDIELEMEHEFALTQIKQSEEQFRLIWENSADGMTLVDKEGSIVMVNDAFCKLVHFNREKLLGNPLSIILSDKVSDIFISRFKKRFRDMDIKRFMEVELDLWNNTKIWVELSNSIFYKDDIPQYVLTIFHDFTDRKQILEENKRLQAQLNQAQKMEAIGRLAGGVAHDFNNLLTVIQGHAQMSIMTMDESDRHYKSINQILKSTDRAASLTSQLLMFSRKGDIHLKILDINPLIQNLLKMIMRLIGENITVDMELSEDLKKIKADEGNIEQVIMNLVVNASDAMPQGGQLKISTTNIIIADKDILTMPESRPGEFILVQIKDDGLGIPKEILPNIFEPFFTTKEKGRGTGLGLSVVYGIVKSHDGWINVTSKLKQGTTFKIYLPVTEVEGMLEGETVSAVSLQELYGHGERVLLIEDEKSVLDFVISILKQFGYSVFSASNCESAREIYQSESGNFDLILSDVVLPDMNGMDLVSSLLKDNLAKTPVIMCSGYTEEKIKQSIISEKGFHFIQKPFSIHEILELIRDVLSGSPAIMK